MKKFDARYSKILLILLGVLVAIVIGFHSNAVGFDSESMHLDLEPKPNELSSPSFEPAGNLPFKLLSLLR